MRTTKPKQGYAISSPEVAYASIRYIASHIKEKGYSPNVRELGASVGYTSSSTAHLLAGMLIDNDLIAITPKIARSIRLTKTGEKLANSKIGDIRAHFGKI
jgi:SOS-response transcriptional repressor LexA